ncbi:DoxX family protein [Calothrix sp. CCY 0018]|uniref:DoxX family protein n=1 Tax=Calothrix sp. CCY 0018 TaxID=3103864 RepID=UPI0039C69592
MGFKKYIPLIGRAFLAAIFLKAAVANTLGFQGIVEMMTSRGLPVPPLLLLGNIFCTLVGGLCILLGFKARIGAILLIIFLVPTTFVFHNPFTDPNELNAFLKNFGLVGAMLFIYYYGTGPVSLDAASATNDYDDTYVTESNRKNV